jgi:arabinan endo-1,5-alpha-L-arabinosidase
MKSASRAVAPFVVAAATIAGAAIVVRADPRVASLERPAFEEVSVHDPSVLRVGETYYVFGSHLAAAKSRDLMTWTRIDAGVRDGNRLIPNVTTEMKDALAWGQSRTFWAGCVARLADGRFYFYYSVCKGDSPRAALGLALADDVEGPYKNVDILIRSGMWDQPSEDGKIYDATVHPNAIDPEVFSDRDGKLWMVYGSYSGGIFILRLDEKTGRPLKDQGYGKKLAGGNHSRIEGPHILFNPVTGYYYLFLSYGGLDANGGYQIRVARSRYPDGPYVDTQAKPMIDAHGRRGSFFDDAAIEPYGAKLIGNFQWAAAPAAAIAAAATAPATSTAPTDGAGYVSPGHNSAYYDAASGKSFIVFHTRFPGRGNMHQLRVHPLLFNEAGWPVIAPHRYAGETIAAYEADDVAGEYQFISHGRKITREITRSQPIRLAADGTIAGHASGSWKKTGDHTATLSIDGSDYHGAFLRQWDVEADRPAMTFSALSDKGVAIWGSATTPAANTSP